MRKTRRVIRREWDLRLASFMKATFATMERELLEHSGFAGWLAKYLLLPLCLLYLAVGFLFQINVFDSLFLGIIVFGYSIFVPDIDSLLSVNSRAMRKQVIEKLELLLLGPVFVYYLLSGKAKPIYSRRPKEFHSVKYLAMYCIFLAVIGLLFWTNPLERAVLPVFGGLGYASHLVVDGYLRPPNWLSVKASGR